MLDLDQAFKDDRTVLVINEKNLTKSIFFNDSEGVAAEIRAGGRRVQTAEWDAFKTKSQRKGE